MDLQKYVVAVSGGVDSVVLLHMLVSRKQDNIDYIVAHFDHGIRPESHRDLLFVKKLAEKYKLKFESAEGNLGAGSSEAVAREARYSFMRSVLNKHSAEKIITAHHQDDLLETMIINIVRKTGPRGLAPMLNSTDILRPLINKTKAELISYAQLNKLKWREDSTNTDESYLRNYIRKNVLPKIAPVRNELLIENKKIERLYLDIDLRLSGMLYGQRVLYRSKFVYLPYTVQRELMRAWLLKHQVSDVGKQTIERATIAAKTLSIGKKIDLDGRYWLVSQPKNLLITLK